MRVAGALVLIALLAGSAAAQKSEPWIFVEYDGGSGDRESYNAAHYYTEYVKDVQDAKELYGWIARAQRTPGEDAECYGEVLKAQTITRAERLLESGLSWYLGNGFTFGDFKHRAVGARVEKTLFGYEGVLGRAHYFSCKKAGFFATSNIGDKSANLIKMGPATNDLNKQQATFRLSTAHELGHVFYNNTAPHALGDAYDALSEWDDWLVEGSIDALAVLHTRDHYGKAYFGPYSNKYTRRFFLSRAYHIPLNLAPGTGDRLYDFDVDRIEVLEKIEKKTLDNLGYQTNGFWYHVIERYLNGQPGRLRELYRRMDANAVKFGVTRIVDRFLDDVDGPSMAGLRHVYPQFLAEYAAWWKHRFDGRMDEGQWLGLGFGGCQPIDITVGRPSASASLTLAEYAGACFTVRIPSILTVEKPDLEIRLTGDDGVVDEVYLGHAAGSGFDDARRNADCYEIVEQKLSPKPAPCLLDPRQGRSGDSLQRYFNIPAIRGSGDTVELTYVATRVPDRIDDVDDDYAQDAVGVTVSLDRARLEAADAPETGTGGDAASSGDDGDTADGAKRGGKGDTGKTAVVDYASKAGRSRVSPEGETSPGAATARDIFSGNIDTMPIADEALRGQLMQRRDAAVTVRVEPGAGEAGNEMPAVGFHFMAETPEPGDKGAVEVQALSSGDGVFGIQNPEQPSRFVIEEYSDETLRFRAVAHVCEGDVAALMTGRGETLCDVFPPRSYRVDGAVSFPTARNSVARLANAETDAYLAYRDLRLDALLGPGDSGGLLRDSGLPVPGSAEGGNNRSGAARQSHAADNDCDCSCSGRDDNPPVRCKLLCGKVWKACAGPE